MLSREGQTLLSHCPKGPKRFHVHALVTHQTSLQKSLAPSTRAWPTIGKIILPSSTSQLRVNLSSRLFFLFPNGPYSHHSKMSYKFIFYSQCTFRSLWVQEEAQQHQALCSPCIHHGRLRGSHPWVPQLRQGYRRLTTSSTPIPLGRRSYLKPTFVVPKSVSATTTSLLPKSPLQLRVSAGTHPTISPWWLCKVFLATGTAALVPHPLLLPGYPLSYLRTTSLIHSCHSLLHILIRICGVSIWLHTKANGTQFRFSNTFKLADYVIIQRLKWEMRL